MRIGLVSFLQKKGNVSYNLAKVEKAMKLMSGKDDLLVFGEAFLQGFDALSFDYEKDLEMALSTDSSVFQQICHYSGQYEIDVLIPFYEKEDGNIYSSAALIQEGDIRLVYRRMSKGWKDIKKCDKHYKEGKKPARFKYKGHPFTLALCGDLWECEKKYDREEFLLWMLYVNFSLEEWKNSEKEAYALQAGKCSDRALIVNSLSHKPDSAGGAFYAEFGRIRKSMPFDQEGILTVEI